MRGLVRGRGGRRRLRLERRGELEVVAIEVEGAKAVEDDGWGTGKGANEVAAGEGCAAAVELWDGGKAAAAGGGLGDDGDGADD